MFFVLTNKITSPDRAPSPSFIDGVRPAPPGAVHWEFFAGGTHAVSWPGGGEQDYSIIFLQQRYVAVFCSLTDCYRSALCLCSLLSLLRRALALVRDVVVEVYAMYAFVAHGTDCPAVCVHFVFAAVDF